MKIKILQSHTVSYSPKFPLYQELDTKNKPFAKINLQTVIMINVTPSGFEPETYCLEGSCSIQLSYGVIFLS